MFALVAAVTAEPHETDVPHEHPHPPVGVYPYGFGYPLVYNHHVPVVHASNVCKNEAGSVVPCAGGIVPGSAIYGFPGHVVPGVVAAEAPADDTVVSVEKREAESDPEAEAEADPYLLYSRYYGGYPYGYGYGYYGGYRGYYGGYYGYYGHPYYGYGGVGCRNGYGALVPCALGK